MEITKIKEKIFGTDGACFGIGGCESGRIGGDPGERKENFGKKAKKILAGPFTNAELYAIIITVRCGPH